MKPWEQEWMQTDGEPCIVVDRESGDFVAEGKAGGVAKLVTGAPAMARALMGVVRAGESMRTSMPGDRNLDAIAAMDTTVPVPADVLRDALAALRKAGVL